MTLETFYTAVFKDGDQMILDNKTFGEEHFPAKPPLSIETNPKTRYLELPETQRVWFTVKFKARATAQEEELNALLMDDGNAISSGKRSFLED